MGLLDNFTQWAQTPQAQPAADGLLAAGLGILARNRGLNSGLAAVGQGGLDGLAQYQQSKQFQQQQQLQNAQLAQMGYALQKNKLLFDAANRLLNPNAAMAQSGGAQPAPQPGQTDVGGLPAGSSGSGPGVQSFPVPMSGQQSPQAGAAAAQSAPSMQAAPATQAAQASGGSPFGNIPNDLAGFGLLTDPTKLFEIAAGQYAPTDFQKTLRAAGIDPNSLLGKQLMQQQIAKQNYIAPTEGRPGGWTISPDGTRTWNPDVPKGAVPVMDAQGNFAGVAPMTGAAGVTAAQSRAQASGPAGFNLKEVWNPKTGQMEYQPTTNIAAAAGGRTAGATTPDQRAIVQTESNGNPNAVSPKGAQGAWQVMPNTQANPGFGVQPAANNSRAELDRVGRDYYNAMQQRYGNPTLASVAYNMGPGATDAWLQGGGQFETLPAETRNYLGKVSLLTAINGRGQQPAPAPQATASQGAPMAAAAPPGYVEGATTFAKANSDAYTNLRNLASTSGDRINTLDNMLALAQGATKFGPGWSERMDRIANLNGYLPSGMQLGGDDTANAQILQKYMSNLAQQYQKALGGTGTDAQLATVLKGTPTPDMMNKAMVEVIPKLKAQELALQAKTNAGDQWLAQNGNNPAGFNKFESMWRQNYDPRIYQMQQMTPTDRQAFLKQQPDAAALRAKTATALQNGWVQ
ncbi:lytic transglycosylase domain-containing protein [Paraburkholderia sp. 22B1P]|uniref:lytic transglycosylase domain-containing protein n=1 Tax=Paraburkholderia sp. 22B1P TaxID=3080498 RepID=UPI00308BD366|nr:lytic transglycosylase domain-containing protein [Paraburkholderia sp. 22B1P]